MRLIDNYFLAGNGSQEFSLEQAVQWGGANGYIIHGSPIIFNGKLIQPMIKYFNVDNKDKNIVEVKKKFVSIRRVSSEEQKKSIAEDIMSYKENFGFCLVNIIMRDEITMVLHMVKYG